MALVQGDEFRVPISVDDRMSPAFSRIGGAIVVFNQGIELAQRTLAGLDKAFEATLGNFGDFEQALVGVGKTTNIQGKALKNFGNEIQDLSEKVPVAANELLGIAQIAGQLGVTGTDNLENFTETIAKLGTASDLAGEQAATSLTRILNVTGENIDQIDELSSVIVALGNNFAATESEIVRVANEVARSTTTFELSSAQVAGLSTAMRSLGIRAELGGSVVGKAFRTIEEALTNGGTALTNLQKLTGMTGDQLKETFEKDSLQVFKAFVDGLGNVEKAGGSVAKAMEAFDLKGDEVNKVLPALAKNSQILTKALNLANDEVEKNSALNEEAAKAFDTLNSDLTRASNALKNLAVDFGEVLAPVVRDIVQSITGFVIKLRELINNVQKIDLNPIIKAFTVLAGSIVAAITAMKIAQVVAFARSIDVNLLRAVTATIPLIKAWAASMLTAASAAAAALAPIVILAAKIIAIAGALTGMAVAIDIAVANFELLTDAASQIGTIIVEEFNKTTGVVDVMSAVFEQVVQIHITFFQFVQKGWTTVVNFVRDVASDIANFFAPVGMFISKVFAGIANFVRSTFDSIVRFVNSSVKKILNFFKPLIEVLKKVGGVAEDFVVGSFQLVEQTASRTGDVVAETFNKITLEGTVTGAAIEELDKLWNGFGDTTVDVGDETVKSMDQVKASVQGVGTQLQATSQEASDLVNKLRADNEKLSLAIANIGKGRKAQIQNQLQSELRLLDLQREKLKNEGKLTAEVQEQLKLKGGLLQEKAGRETEQVGQSPLFGPEQVDMIGSAFGEGAASIAGAASSMMTPVTGMMAASDMILGAIQKLIDFVPETLNKIANIFNSLTELPMKITEALGNVIDSIGNFIANAIPNILREIPKRLSQLLIELPKTIMNALVSLLQELPGLIVTVIEQIVDMIPEIVQVMITNLPKIMVALIEFLIKGMPKIAIALAKAMLIEVPIAIVEGIVLALRELGGVFSDLLKGIFPVNEIKEGLSEVGDSISRSTSQLFKVVDLEASARGLDVADRIRNAIASGSSQASNIFTKLWNILKGVWDKVFGWFEKIFGPIVDGAFEVVRKLWDGLKIIVEAAWQFVKSLWDGLKGIVKAAFTFVKSLWDGLRSIVKDAFSTIIVFFKKLLKGDVKGAFQAVFDFFGRTFETLWEKAFKPFLTFMKTVFNILWEKAIKPFFTFMETVFKTIWENAIKPIVDFFSDVFATIWAEAFQPVVDFFSDVFATVWEKAFQPLVDFFGGIFNAVFKPITDHFGEAFKAIGDFLIAPFNAIVDFFKNIFKGNIEGAFQGIFDFFTGIPDMLFKALEALNPANLLSKLFPTPGDSKGFIEGKLGFDVPIVSFATGGKVPGNPIVDGDSPLNDRVLSLLSPGEIVLSRSEVADIEKFFGKIPGFFGGFKKPKFVQRAQKAAASAGGAVSSVAQGAVDTAKGVAGKIATGDISGALRDLDPTNNESVKAALDGIKDIGANFGDLFAKFKDKIFSESLKGVDKLMFQGFATGGYVDVPNGKVTNGILRAQTGAVAGGGGGSGGMGNQGTDTIRAALTPGEFVVNREATRNNLGLLSFINEAKRPVQPAGDQVMNMSVVINAKTALTPEQVRREIVPTIEKEMRRKSQQGRFVLDQAGIRT